MMQTAPGTWSLCRKHSKGHLPPGGGRHHSSTWEQCVGSRGMFMPPILDVAESPIQRWYLSTTQFSASHVKNGLETKSESSAGVLLGRRRGASNRCTLLVGPVLRSWAVRLQWSGSAVESVASVWPCT